MIQRGLAERAIAAKVGYPAILISGPRQSGKTTFAKAVFGDLPYVNLESPVERVEFDLDPVGFLDRFEAGAILDEVQHTPDLLSHLQVRIDRDALMGQWVLTGSQQVDLVRETSQSLAGRVAMLEMLPFSHAELRDSPRKPATLDAAVLMGGYAPLFDERRILEPVEWIENYLATYVHRDVRSAVDPRNLRTFDLFLRLCATGTGQELNKSSLARDCSVDQKTIGSWIAALEACYVIRLVRPYSNNLGKRLVKRPKLHFLDSGLACRLLQITDVQQLSVHPLRGALFETWCYTEVIKHLSIRSEPMQVWFWRSTDGVEVDMLIQRGRQLVPVEVKAGKTPSSSAAKWIERIRGLFDRDKTVELARAVVVYGGAERVERSTTSFVPWNQIDQALRELG